MVVVVWPVRRLAGWGLFSSGCVACKEASRLGSRCWVLPYLQLAHFIGQGRLEAREHGVLKRARQTGRGRIQNREGIRWRPEGLFHFNAFLFMCVLN